MELELVPCAKPEDANLILGQAHFIKTVEDIAEAIVTTVPGAKYGLAFSEASGPCLVRHEGNDPELRAAAIAAARALGAGHSFVVLLRAAYPINLLNALRAVPEVCTFFCATANPVEVVVARGPEGGAILGVIDGSAPRGVEGEAETRARKQFLRGIGYKFSG